MNGFEHNSGATHIQGMLAEGYERKYKRYELAKEFMLAIVNDRPNLDKATQPILARQSVELADALLKALEETQ